MGVEQLASSLRGRSVAMTYLNFGPYHVARLRAVARALEKHGASLVAIELSSSEKQYPWKVDRSAEPFQWVTLFSDRSVEQISAAEQSRAVRDVLNKHNPAAVAVVGWSHPYLREAISWCRRTRSVSVLCGTSTARTGLKIEKTWTPVRRVWWKELVKRFIIRGMDAGFAGGNECRDYLASLGIPKDRIFIKYDVVDNDFFERIATDVKRDQERWRRHFDVPEKFFFYPARILSIKNHARLLQAYGKYLSRTANAPWGLVFIGSGPDEAEVDQAIQELNSPLVSRRKFAQIEEIAQYYGLASALIFPSLNETWGLIVNEAAATSLPVLVSTDCTCAEHLVADGKNGYLLDAHDVDQIADRMLRITALPDDELAAMGRASREIVGEWHPDNHAAGLMEAIAAGFDARRSRA